MPRPAKPARLYLLPAEQAWVIRDGPAFHRTGCSTGERQAAEAALAEYIAKKRKPDFGAGDPNQAKIADVLIAYNETTNDLHAISAVPMLREFWAGKTLGAITPKLSKDYVDWRCAQVNRNARNQATARTVKPSTARRDLEILRAAINHAVKEKLIAHGVALELPGKPPARMRYLTKGEADRLLAAAWSRPWSHHVARFILLGLYTGSRHRALLSLQWMPNTTGGWIDLDQGLIYRKSEHQSETDKRRPPVGISELLGDYLREWEKAKGRYVIEFQGQPVRNIRNGFRRVARDAGLGDDVTPHTLRHTFASWALQAGVSYAEVAAAIGTTEAMIISVYGHLHPDYTRKTVEAVAQFGGVSVRVSVQPKIERDVK